MADRLLGRVTAAHLPLSDDEEVHAVACRHKAVRVKHQSLVSTSLAGLVGGRRAAAAAAAAEGKGAVVGIGSTQHMRNCE